VVDNGILTYGLSNTDESDVAAVNTATPLASLAGSIVPGLGDVIAKYDHSAGASVLDLFMFYHSH